MELVHTPTHTTNGNPVVMSTRVGTSDLSIVNATMGYEDEYGLRDRTWTGWGLDIGSSIGVIAIALARDNPDLQVVAVECVPENVEMLRLNVTQNGLDERIHIVDEAAGAPGQSSVSCWSDYTHVPGTDDGYTYTNRYIGNVFRGQDAEGRTADVPGVSLGQLLDRFGIEEVAICKIDCEGCEWDFFRSPDLVRIREITGEWHDGHVSLWVDFLSKTHEVTVVRDDGGVGLFRAVRR